MTEKTKEMIKEAVSDFSEDIAKMVDSDGEILLCGHYLTVDEYVRNMCNDKGLGSFYLEYLGDMLLQFDDRECIP